MIIKRDTGIDFEPWVRVTLLLDDPDSAVGTWSVAAVQALDELARAVARDLDIPDWLRIMHVAISEAGGIFPAAAIARARAAAA